jgi:type IV secretion system protein VirB8
MNTDLETYLTEAASWDAQRAAQSDRQRRIAYGVAGVFALCAISASTALALLLPLKSVEPYVIRVDNHTGAVDAVLRYEGGAPLSETITRFLITHYVTTCERFVYATAEQDYSECGAFHSPERNQQWAAIWSTGNPDSPLNRYKDGTTVRIEIQSISFFERGSGATDLAQVRYTRLTEPGGTGATTTSHQLATLQFAYGKPAADAAIRRWNPLGFRIQSFRSEPEVVTPATTHVLADNPNPGPLSAPAPGANP